MTVLHDLWRVLWVATWGNNTAALEWAVAGVAIAYLKRDTIGRHLAAWWAKHHGPHEVEHHLEALRLHEAEKRTADQQGETS